MAKMGLTDADKKKILYFSEKRKKEEEERWAKFTKSPEYIKIGEAYQRAVEDHLHQLLMADFYARDLEPTVEQVASATSHWTARLCDVFTRTIFYHTEIMLERFDLVKKKAKKRRLRIPRLL